MNQAAIEQSFPIQEVSEYSAKEKNIRHGHISTLHIWWSRKPLAASRATIYAALVPAFTASEMKSQAVKTTMRKISHCCPAELSHQ